MTADSSWLKASGQPATELRIIAHKSVLSSLLLDNPTAQQESEKERNDLDIVYRQIQDYLVLEFYKLFWGGKLQRSLLYTHERYM